MKVVEVFQVLKQVLPALRFYLNVFRKKEKRVIREEDKVVSEPRVEQI